jgi:LysM repeat protein
MRAAITAAALLASVFASAPAQAQKLDTIKVRVKKGDTLALLAAEYYGDRDYAVFIMNANNLTHPRKLRPGERIRVPIQREVTAAVGDTLDGLADDYMGDARRAEFLAEFNNLAVDATLTAGQRIVIPFHVTHRAASLETIDSIAAAYFRDSKKAALLRRYNFTDKEALSKGEKLVVPIYNVRVRASKLPPPDTESTEREARLREMEERAVRALPDARAAWRAGEYAAVKKALVDLDADYLPGDVAADVGVLLGGAYIAFDDNDSALAAFEKVLSRKPGHVIRAYDFSPKIRAVWKKAGGDVDNSR